LQLLFENTAIYNKLSLKKNKSMATISLADLKALVNEAVEEKLFTDIRSENEKESKNVEKDAEERIDDSTPTKSSTQIDGYRGEQPPSGRNALNLNYDRIDKKYQERVKALVQGKASPEQADIDVTAAGVDAKGNEKFFDKMAADNKKYAEISGATQIKDRIAHPPKSKPQFATEGKVKVGDIFVKDNLNLKVTGLNEDKTRINFIDESGKKYSLAVSKFKQVVKEDKMVRQGAEMLTEVAPLVAAGARAAAPMAKQMATSAAASAGDEAGKKVVDAVTTEEKEDKKEVSENKTKRLIFKKLTFINENHAKSLIAEQYKTPGNKFVMIDNAGNEYLIECDINKQALVLEYKNVVKARKDLERMKNLWEYDTRKAVGGSTINESSIQKDLRNKTKQLLQPKK